MPSFALLNQNTTLIFIDLFLTDIMQHGITSETHMTVYVDKDIIL